MELAGYEEVVQLASLQGGGPISSFDVSLERALDHHGSQVRGRVLSIPSYDERCLKISALRRD